MRKFICIATFLLVFMCFSTKSLAYSNITESQLNQLYSQISEQTTLDVEYIKVIYALMGSNCDYVDKVPDIYNDLLINPLVLEGAQTEIIEMPNIEVSEYVQRGTNKFLPDALYSVCNDIEIIAAKRYLMDRGTFKEYFEALEEDVKMRICLAEAILIYTGTSEEVANNYYNAYSSVVFNKNAGENVVKVQKDGLVLKSKYSEIFKNYGFQSAKQQSTIAVILAYDKRLAQSQSMDELQYKYVLPYKINYTSRENMMVAAMSLVGKVRYVWGGGHSGACYMDGINPVWAMWESLYPTSEYKTLSNGSVVQAVGFNKCIKPSGSWCPIHGYSGGTCSNDRRVSSIDEYINERKDIFIGIDSDKFRQLTSTIDFNDNTTLHTLEGLDCSGFASWLYNQITDDYQINSVAVNFTNQNGIKDVTFGEELLPGDIFSWTTHIVIIVGKVADNSKAYVTVEQTTNVLKFGVVYYSGASKHDIELAEQVALEANMLLGNLYDREAPHVYCMNNVGKYTEEVPIGEVVDIQYQDDGAYVINSDSEDTESDSEDSEDYDSESYEDTDSEEQEQAEEQVKTIQVQKQIISIGRFSGQFIDEETAIAEYNKPLKDLTAVEIIQHTIKKLPVSYISGYEAYKGDIFDKTQASLSVGVSYYDN